MKKKKVWKTPSSEKLALSTDALVRKTLCDIREGRHPFCHNEDRLFELLEKQVELIDSIENPEVKLELLARFLNTDGILAEFDYEDFAELYTDMASYFVEEAERFENKEYLAALIHDLALNHTGEDGRSAVFLMVENFLPKERLTPLFEEILETVETHNLENAESVLEALCDMADCVQNTEIYERSRLLQDPDRSNSTLLDIANFCLTAKDIASTKRLLGAVTLPQAEDLEDFLDLRIAVLEAEGSKSEMIALAEELYERFPKEMHLGKLCSIVSIERRSALLDNYIKYHSGTNISIGFLQILVAFNEIERLEVYLNQKGDEQLTTLPAETLSVLVEELEDKGADKLAARIREWIVEEPEDLRE